MFPTMAARIHYVRKMSCVRTVRKTVGTHQTAARTHTQTRSEVVIHAHYCAVDVCSISLNMVWKIYIRINNMAACVALKIRPFTRRPYEKALVPNTSAGCDPLWWEPPQPFPIRLGNYRWCVPETTPGNYPIFTIGATHKFVIT